MLGLAQRKGFEIGSMHGFLDSLETVHEHRKVFEGMPNSLQPCTRYLEGQVYSYKAMQSLSRRSCVWLHSDAMQSLRRRYCVWLHSDAFVI